MINSYKDVLNAIDYKGTNAPCFVLNATNEQSVGQIIPHLAHALRSGECPEGLCLDLTQDKDRKSIRAYHTLLELNLKNGFNPLLPTDLSRMHYPALGFCPRRVVELTSQDMKNITQALESGPRIVTLWLPSGVKTFIANPHKPITDNPRWTPLMLAIVRHKIQVAMEMVMSPEFVYTPHRGGSALMIASSSGYRSECKDLIALLTRKKREYENNFIQKNDPTPVSPYQHLSYVKNGVLMLSDTAKDALRAPISFLAPY